MGQTRRGSGRAKRRSVSLRRQAKAKARAILREAEGLDKGTVTQDGIAQVFARRFEDQLRFCHHTGAWFEWTGTHWKMDKTSLAFQFCRELSREFTMDSGQTELKEVRRISFAGGVEKFAKSDRLMAVTCEIWDRDPFLLGTPAGTVDLRTGKLREPDPADGITRITSVSPAATVDCPRWLQFLEQTFGDAELIGFIKQWGGYCLTGDINEHALVFGFGNGKNGKSVWMNTITGIMGDYATTAAMETFTASKFDRHPTELAMLRGARLVTASETEEGRSWAESRIKQITGGDPITARFMQKDFFTFQPNFKLSIIGNHKPLLRNVDEAARRRFNLIPFNRTPINIDPLLGQKLRAEWPGILRWLIEGCLDWQNRGLVRPKSVIAATESYFEDQDLIGQWLDEKCDAEPENKYKWEATAMLFASWTEFSNLAGEGPGSRKTFSTELTRRGFENFSQGHANIRSFRGLRLKPSAKRYRDDD
jgi:putative DNA primase/helicase